MRKQLLAEGQRIRVLVVDDSVVIRRLITHALEEDAGLEVVGAASNGVLALQRIPLARPDVLTLDIEMPVMDGLETLRQVRRDFPDLRVIMFSTLTERGGAVTLEALAMGADDYVTKPSNEGTLERSLERLRGELIPKIKQFFHVSAAAKPAPPPAVPRRPAGLFPAHGATPRIVVIGCSTGGPTALVAVLPKFPQGFSLPILVVQHMPPLFTRLLAERLNATCQLPTCEARDGQAVEGGKILIAPGDFHMKVVENGGSVRVHLEQSPPLNFCRPAVDALFCSAAQVYGGATVAAVLTGMGQDGLVGAGALKALGAAVVAQDQDSSVVWGMPGAIVHAGLADSVLPLDQCGQEILRLASRR